MTRVTKTPVPPTVLALMIVLGVLLAIVLGVGGWWLFSEMTRIEPISVTCGQAHGVDPLNPYSTEMCVRAGGPPKVGK